MEIDVNNSIEHELAKFICVYLIRNGWPADNLSMVFENHFFRKMDSIGLQGPIQFHYKKFKHEWERPVVVTEARFKVNVGHFPNPKYEEIIYLGRGDRKGKNIISPSFEARGRRADIFILDTGEIVEIETDTKVRKEGDNVTTICI